MTKAKIGLPITILAAAAFLMFLFGGYTPALLIVGYILVAEEDTWLKRSAVKAFAVAIIFSCANFVLGLLPDVLNIIESLLGIFGVHFYFSFIHNVFNFLSQIVSLLKTLILAGLGVMALFNKTIEVPFINKIIE